MYIALENGDVIRGECASPGMAKTELVFTTSYTGYEESLTDPSYQGQGLIFCYPLIGNYGMDERRFESDSCQPDAVIAREFTEDVRDWLCDNGVPAVEGVDTRSIVSKIRNEGSLKAGIASTQRAAQRLCAEAVVEPSDTTHTPLDSLPERYGESNRPIIALLDCGVKRAMIKEFVGRGAMVIRLPWDVNPDHISSYDPDLLFVSNGPGNPENYQKAIETVRYWHGTIPIAGICLGLQLITLALGGSTRKMKFGHRGSNQPVIDVETHQVKMTTQNHSYEVEDCPDELYIAERNVNDQSIEALVGDSVICRQYHPEAHPGPHDSLGFFKKVIDLANDS